MWSLSRKNFYFPTLNAQRAQMPWISVWETFSIFVFLFPLSFCPCPSFVIGP